MAITNMTPIDRKLGLGISSHVLFVSICAPHARAPKRGVSVKAVTVSLACGSDWLIYGSVDLLSGLSSPAFSLPRHAHQWEAVEMVYPKHEYHPSVSSEWYSRSHPNPLPSFLPRICSMDCSSPSHPFPVRGSKRGNDGGFSPFLPPGYNAGKRSIPRTVRTKYELIDAHLLCVYYLLCSPWNSTTLGLTAFQHADLNAVPRSPGRCGR
jgi:hypothetical protein